MKVELIHITPHAEEIIEQAGRTAYLSFDKITAESAGNFVQMLIDKGHESVIEHAYATFRISGVSGTMTHQLVRHRLASYTQQSQRVVNEGDLKKYSIPPSIQNSDITSQKVYESVMTKAFEVYDILLSRGINKEDARFVLPNACQTQIVMSGNLRNWRHVIEMRGSIHAQWEIRSVIREILRILKRECPQVFDDLTVYDGDL